MPMHTGKESGPQNVKISLHPLLEANHMSTSNQVFTRGNGMCIDPWLTVDSRDIQYNF